MDDLVKRLETMPILYTDSIKGQQTCRDDLWAITTEDIKAVRDALSRSRGEALEEAAKMCYENPQPHSSENQSEEYIEAYNTASSDCGHRIRALKIAAPGEGEP